MRPIYYAAEFSNAQIFIDKLTKNVIHVFHIGSQMMSFLLSCNVVNSENQSQSHVGRNYSYLLRFILRVIFQNKSNHYCFIYESHNFNNNYDKKYYLQVFFLNYFFQIKLLNCSSRLPIFNNSNGLLRNISYRLSILKSPNFKGKLIMLV